MEGALGCRKCLMGPRSCRNFRRLFAVRLAVVTNRARGLAGSARTVLLRPIVVEDRLSGLGIVKLSERRAEEGRFSESWGQAGAPVLEISRQAAKARSREVRRKSAGADWG